MYMHRPESKAPAIRSMAATIATVIIPGPVILTVVTSLIVTSLLGDANCLGGITASVLWSIVCCFWSLCNKDIS